MTQEDKLKLKADVQKGRYAENFLTEFFNKWFEREAKDILSKFAKAEAREFFYLQARLLACRSIRDSFVSAVAKGKTSAEKLQKARRT